MPPLSLFFLFRPPHLLLLNTKNSIAPLHRIAMATSSPANNAHLLSALLLLLLLSDVDHTVSTPSPHTQATILLTLKKSLTSPSTIHSKLNGWDPSIHHCTWPGLSCDSSTSLVTSLDLSNSNISGFIPACLFSLTSLRHLSLSSNSLSGHLPSSLATLPSLLHLNLSSNHFNGSLSSSFSHTLQILDLYDNDFSGPLPPSLPSLPQLRHLDLGGNYFSGIIPLTYGDFPRLEYLSLAGNDLAGAIPAVLGNVTTLKQLFLGYYNDFDGGIPPELGKLANLAHLDLSSCGLEGVIPPELGYLSNLDTLFVQTNQLTGTIPPTLGNLTLLRSLDLSNNALAGSIPVELSKLRNLQLLYLFINKFHGDIPAFVSELPHLELLELWQNNLTGPIPPGLGKEARLRVVDLSSNRLTGSIPSTLCHGRRLEILILQNNFLFGPLPSDFGNCRTLTRVRLGQNYLTGAVPRSFLYLPDLQLVELQNNYLTGTLAEFSTPEPKQQPLRKLAQINLSNNRLFGWIPSSIGNIDNLQILLLDGNQFTGEIPRMLGKLKRVLKIDLGRNNLTGSIPVEISGCTLLSYLDVSKNKLSGPLPPEISQIHILNYLNVSWNRLNGSIPKELGAIKSLTSVDFTHNDFGGQIPNNGQFAYFNSTSFRFNPHLCGSSPSPSSSYCNGSTTYVLPSQSNQERERRKTGVLPGKFKLLLALVLLACSLVFAVTVAIKTRSMIHGGGKRRIKRWKMTAFQKVQFKAEDVVDCMKDANIIGRGGAGVVYRGCTPLGSGETVAVKRLLGIGHGGGDGGFNAEIQTLGNIRHRNIVRLLAFCSNGETKLLVYEYMPNGSLGEVLHGKSGGYLRWELRLKIAMEAARGLCYLHHDCCPPILHRDVKSNNILLNGDWEAHVSDFGLAKFLRGVDSGMSECMSSIAGSYGYIAPEYAYTLKVDEKSDVYSFGVVLLELITGRKPVGDFGEEGLDIVQWAKMSTNLRRESVVVILDKRLSEVPMEEAMQVFFVSMLCVKEQSIERPTMREVVQMLGEAKQTNLVPFHGS